MTIDINALNWDALTELQDACRTNSINKGFAEDFNDLRKLAAELQKNGRDHLAKVIIRDYFGNRLLLVVGEVSEAHEELRKGEHGLAETYYPTKPSPGYTHGMPDARTHKPEGIPSELADTFIRVLDLAAELGIDLAVSVKEKMIYNATRPHMHGKKF